MPPLTPNASPQTQQKEGVDLERGLDNTINVAWTEPGEWITYTVEHAGDDTMVLDVAVR